MSSDTNRLGKALILVVERDPHIRELETYFLNEAGFDVEFAPDGEIALDRVKHLRPDIVITRCWFPSSMGSRSAARSRKTKRLATPSCWCSAFLQ